MGNCGSCGGAKRAPENLVAEDPAQRVDPTAAFFNVTAKWVVKRRAGDTQGRSFATLTAAEDYARRNGGVLEQINVPN